MVSLFCQIVVSAFHIHLSLNLLYRPFFYFLVETPYLVCLVQILPLIYLFIQAAFTFLVTSLRLSRRSYSVGGSSDIFANFPDVFAQKITSVYQVLMQKWQFLFAGPANTQIFHEGRICSKTQ